MQREIVGAKIGGTITNSPAHIAAAIESGMRIEWLERKRMKFMAACDLGINWEKMANGPTLFDINISQNIKDKEV